MDGDKTVGQVAFEAWAMRLDRTYPAGWNQLKPTEREGWEDVAEAAIASRMDQVRAMNRKASKA
jgi:hypothetical protein